MDNILDFYATSSSTTRAMLQDFIYRLDTFLSSLVIAKNRTVAPDESFKTSNVSDIAIAQDMSSAREVREFIKSKADFVGWKVVFTTRSYYNKKSKLDEMADFLANRYKKYGEGAAVISDDGVVSLSGVPIRNKTARAFQLGANYFFGYCVKKKWDSRGNKITCELLYDKSVEYRDDDVRMCR